MSDSRVVKQDGLLIDFLAQAWGGSRRAAKRMLDARGVFVNGRRVWMARHPLRPGDHVEVVAAERTLEKASIPILYHQGAWLVVNKPAGLVTTGTSGVEARLRADRKDPSLAAVHRLDRDTTGCLLFARGEAARAAAVGVFRRGAVEKLYEAIVLGRFSRTGKTDIRTPIDGKRAVSEVTLCAVGREASHVRVRILTGRTHQIRKHLMDIGHPVLGDRAYGTARPLPPPLHTVPRPLLHASRLALLQPGAEGRIEAHAPLPDDFRAWLDRLGLLRKDRVRRGDGT